MRKTMKQLTDGATSLLVLALGLGLVSTAWAAVPTPTAVWQSGEFETAKGGYTISLNGNSVDDTSGNLVIGDYDANNHLGATIDLSGANATAVSILIKYAELPAATKTHINMSSVADSEGKEFGAYITEADSQRMATFLKNESVNNYHYSQTAPTMIMASGSGYFLLTYGTATGTFAYSANNIKALSGNGNGSAKGSSAISAISIGGPVTYIDHHTSGDAWSGAVIEKVVLFVGKQCSVDEIQQYCGYTADLASELLPWRYNENCNIYAWREDYNSTKAYHEAKFSSVGADGSFGTAATVDFTQFGNSRPQPGHVLYYDKSGYQPSSNAKFNPFTIGGLLVRARGKDDANYSIVGDSAGNRSTYLGLSNYTTYWTFDEGFTFNRTSDLMIYGTANVEIAAGKIFDCNSAQNSYATQLGSDARLVLSGEGNMKVSTLNATNGGIDFSALKTRTAESAFITGTLEVGANTKLIFPEGTDLSAGYPVASTVTGTLPSTFEIGDLTYEDKLTTTDGKIYSSSLLFATIDSTEATTFATKFPSAGSASDCTLRVSESATMSIGSATTVGTLRIDVAEGKTLTLSGTSLTATTIYVTGKGTVKVTADGALQGTLKGDGTVMYSGVLPASSGVTLNDSAWTGTVWIYNFGSINSTVQSNLGTEMPNWGNAKSKVKFTLVKAFAPNANITCPYTLVLEDGASASDYAWRCDNGFGSATATFGALSGSGTFYDHGSVASKFTFNSFAGFTGTFDITSGGHQIAIPSTAALTITKDASIRFANRGLSGSVTIESGKTLTVYGGDGLNYDGSGTVNIYGTMAMGDTRWTLGPSNFINIHEGGQITGNGPANGNLDMNKAGATKTIHAYGNAAISATISARQDDNCQIIVDEGKTLTVSGRIFGSRKIYKRGLGMLKLSYIGSEAVIEPTLEEGYVEFADTYEHNLGSMRDLTGYKVSNGSVVRLNQTQVEYGVGEMVVTGVDSSVTEIRITRYDNTQATLTPAAGQATLAEDPVVSGKACWYDFTFTNTLQTAGGSVASLTLTDDHTSSATSEYGDITDARSNTYRGVKSYRRPYGGINLGSKSQFTVATYATMPSSANTVLMAFGGTYDNNTALILASGADGDKAVLYYYVKSSNTLTELKTMPAIGSRTVPHLYVFQKVSDHQINIYLDGKLSLAYLNNDISFSVSSGFQMAAVYGGTPAGVSRLENSSDASAIAMTRIYDRILTSKEIAALKEAWPYYSPNGNSDRELVTDETASDWNENGKWEVDGASANAAKANSVVVLENGAGASASVAVNLASDTSYESLTVSGENAVSFALKGGYTGKIMPAATSIETDATLAVNAVDLAHGPVEVAAGNTLTFDVTSLINDTVNSLAPVQLSGVVTLGDGAAIAVTPTTSTLWDITATPDDGGNYWVNFNPKRDNTSIYWKSTNSGDWTGANDVNHIFTTEAGGDTTTPFYFGDTVVIRDDVQLWLKDAAAGISFSIENNATVKFSRSGDGATYAMKGQTVAIAAGATAQPERYANNGWDAGNPTIYGVTFTGLGNVKVVDGETLTLSGGSVISAPLTGSGTVNLESPSSMTVSPGASWTGTVVLPTITSGGQDFNIYGNKNSIVALPSMTGGWLNENGKAVNTTLRLDGNMSPAALSNWTYSFFKITGNGSLTIPNSASPTSITITELANYNGTLINNHESVGVTVTRVTKSADVDGGALLLATNGVGVINVSAFEVSGVSIAHYAAAGGFYRGAARYDGTVYKTFAEAIDAVEEDGASLSDITVLDSTAAVPDGYYIADGTVGKCPAAIVYDVGDPDYYNTVQAAVNAANAKTHAGDHYEYVAVYANAAVTTTKTLKIKPMNEAVVTVSVPGITSEYALNDATDGNGVVTYTIDPASTDYTWVTGSGVWDTTAVAPWRYDVESTPTQATRAPGSVDSVAFASAADVTVGANVSVSSMTVSSAITLTKSTADVTVTATTGGIVLTDAAASITVSGVTLSPAPTTTVAKSYVKFNEVTSTYSVEKYKGVRIIAR